MNSGNIYLIGPMAAGKSTIGRVLAKRLGKTFYDTDHEIIKCTGVEISLIFELEGEEGFRKRESEKLLELSKHQSSVVATGGGIVLNKENRSLLEDTGIVIYLACSVDQQLKRTRHDTKRPLLKVSNPKKKLQELMKHRAPLYESLANIVINTERGSLRGAVNQILRYLKKAHD